MKFLLFFVSLVACAQVHGMQQQLLLAPQYDSDSSDSGTENSNSSVHSVVLPNPNEDRGYYTTDSGSDVFSDDDSSQSEADGYISDEGLAGKKARSAWGELHSIGEASKEKLVESTIRKECKRLFGLPIAQLLDSLGYIREFELLKSADSKDSSVDVLMRSLDMLFDAYEIDREALSPRAELLTVDLCHFVLTQKEELLKISGTKKETKWQLREKFEEARAKSIRLVITDDRDNDMLSDSDQHALFIIAPELVELFAPLFAGIQNFKEKRKFILSPAWPSRAEASAQSTLIFFKKIFYYLYAMSRKHTLSFDQLFSDNETDERDHVTQLEKYITKIYDPHMDAMALLEIAHRWHLNSVFHALIRFIRAENEKKLTLHLAQSLPLEFFRLLTKHKENVPYGIELLEMKLGGDALLELNTENSIERSVVVEALNSLMPAQIEWCNVSNASQFIRFAFKCRHPIVRKIVFHAKIRYRQKLTEYIAELLSLDMFPFVMEDEKLVPYAIALLTIKLHGDKQLIEQVQNILSPERALVKECLRIFIKNFDEPGSDLYDPDLVWNLRGLFEDDVDLKSLFDEHTSTIDHYLGQAVQVYLNTLKDNTMENQYERALNPYAYYQNNIPPLGDRYRNDKDPRDAWDRVWPAKLLLYRAAAAKGYANAQNRLGCYLSLRLRPEFEISIRKEGFEMNGRVTKAVQYAIQQETHGLYWYNKALEQFHVDSYRILHTECRSRLRDNQEPREHKIYFIDECEKLFIEMALQDTSHALKLANFYQCKVAIANSPRIKIACLYAAIKWAQMAGTRLLDRIQKETYDAIKRIAPDAFQRKQLLEEAGILFQESVIAAKKRLQNKQAIFNHKEDDSDSDTSADSANDVDITDNNEDEELPPLSPAYLQASQSGNRPPKEKEGDAKPRKMSKKEIKSAAADRFEKEKEKLTKIQKVDDGKKEALDKILHAEEKKIKQFRSIRALQDYGSKKRAEIEESIIKGNKQCEKKLKALEAIFKRKLARLKQNNSDDEDEDKIELLRQAFKLAKEKLKDEHERNQNIHRAFWQDLEAAFYKRYRELGGHSIADWKWREFTRRLFG